VEADKITVSCRLADGMKSGPDVEAFGGVETHGAADFGG
jgi:hypothetical protein